MWGSDSAATRFQNLWSTPRLWLVAPLAHVTIVCWPLLMINQSRVTGSFKKKKITRPCARSARQIWYAIEGLLSRFQGPAKSSVVSLPPNLQNYEEHTTGFVTCLAEGSRLLVSELTHPRVQISRRAPVAGPRSASLCPCGHPSHTLTLSLTWSRAPVDLSFCKALATDRPFLLQHLWFGLLTHAQIRFVFRMCVGN